MIKTLAKSIREYKLPSILSPIFVACEVLLEVLIPSICSDLITFLQGDTITNIHHFAILSIDTGVSFGTIGDGLGCIFAYSGMLLALIAIALVCGILSGRMCAKASAGFAKNLRKDVYYKVQDFSFENIDSYSTSSLVTRLTTDITNVQNAYMAIIRIAVRSPLMFAMSLGFAFTINWLLALIFLGTALLMIAIMALVPSHALKIYRRAFKKYDKMNLRVEEDVRGARVVKAFVREDYEKKKFNDAAEDIRSDLTKAEMLLATVNPIVNFVIYLLMVFIFLLGTIMVFNDPSATIGTISVGDFTALMQYAMMILFSLLMLVMVVVNIVMALESGNRIAAVLTTESTLKSPENGLTAVADGSVEFDGVDFSYVGDENKLVLTDINLKIKSGQTVGILGNTGSSKSSLVQLIPRLYDVTAGSLKVGGVDVREYDLNALRSSVAMVLQKNVLFSGSIKENIRWGKEDATDEEIMEACKLAAADEFIEAMPDKYDTHIEQGGTNVSGGQRQRLCIARALIANPKIIIFDDSTSAVDTKTDAMIRKSMAESLPNATKIIIAQRVSSLEHSDMIVVLDAGRIVACGTHAELMKTCDIYREEYMIQTRTGDGGEEDA